MVHRIGVLGGVLLVLLIGMDTPVSASEPRPAQPDVLCGGSNSLVYRFKPTACDFHSRGAAIGSEVSYTLTRRLHWLHWGSRTATASGEIEYPMEGWFRVHIRLADPHASCGRAVFTSARFHVSGRPAGFRVLLDECA